MEDHDFLVGASGDIGGIENVAEHAILARVVDIDVVTNRAGVVIGELGTTRRADGVAILAGDSLFDNVVMVIQFEGTRRVRVHLNFRHRRGRFWTCEEGRTDA